VEEPGCCIAVVGMPGFKIVLYGDQHLPRPLDLAGITFIFASTSQREVSNILEEFPESEKLLKSMLESDDVPTVAKKQDLLRG